MELSWSEVLNLAIGLAMVPLIWSVRYRLRALPGPPYFFIGYVAVLCSYTFTILEGVGGMLGDVLSVLEHAALFVAGLLFCLAAFQARARALGRR